MSKTPTARTLEALRKDGWTAGVVEKFNHHTKRKHDFLECIDIIAVRPGTTLGVQATSADHISHRVAKIRETPGAAAWLAAGNTLEIWGWKKRKVKPGGKLMTWQVSVRDVTELALNDPDL